MRARTAIVGVVAVFLCACASGGGGGAGGGSGGGGSGASFDYANDPGVLLYAQMCQSCHGEVGQGGIGPKLEGLGLSTDKLASTIDATMPKNQPDQCKGDCAQKIARFINQGLTSQALACTTVTPARRRLRLLTRREYRNTVHDLFGDLGTHKSCQSDLDCGFREFCGSAGTCQPSACNEHTFVYDPKGAQLTSVHVAGSFNGWPQTIAGGGLPLTYSSKTGLWTGQFTIPEGTQSYKFVLNESQWVTDPRDPNSEPDGFGGQNSVLSLSCSGSVDGVDPTADFPAETRPDGFPFDTDSDAAVVTSVHAEAYLKAAKTLADKAVANLAQITSCDYKANPSQCADSLVRKVGLRAFRRPLTDAEVARYVKLVNGATSFSDGAGKAIEAMLVSPNFLYRSELGTQQKDGTYKLTGYEVASALSYMFWGTMPDQELFDAAASGKLDTTAGIEKEARRLLADPRSHAIVGTFALEWLGAENIASVDKRPDLFPNFNDKVRAALEEETRKFVEHVVFDSSGTFGELFTAKYTFVNDTIASLYGMQPPGTGDTFVKRAYPDGHRSGILGEGSILGTYAHSDQTSPILRGLFVRRRLLCQRFPPPPPNAGAVPAVDPNATTRERFKEHTANPFCAGCHKYIDDVGFGFERFDPIGRYRATENGLAVDPSGNMNDVEGLGTGTSAPFNTEAGLAQILAKSRSAQSCFVRQYFRFVRGFQETLANRCARKWIEKKFRDSGYNIKELMIAVATAPDFTVRRP